MCTYITELIAVEGSGKGRAGWFDLTDASVYVDHPVAAQAEHTLIKPHRLRAIAVERQVRDGLCHESPPSKIAAGQKRGRLLPSVFTHWSNGRSGIRQTVGNILTHHSHA